MTSRWRTLTLERMLRIMTCKCYPRSAVSLFIDVNRYSKGGAKAKSVSQTDFMISTIRIPTSQVCSGIFICRSVAVDVHTSY